MTKFKMPTRNFSMSDAKLKQQADFLLILIREDATDFASYGVGAARCTELADLTEVFSDFPSDEQLQGRYMQAVAARRQAKNKLLGNLRATILKVSLHYANGKAGFGGYGNQNFARMNDEELIRSARLIHHTALGEQSDLAQYGITTAALESLSEDTEAFDLAIDAQSLAKSRRTSATYDRIKLANQLYALLVKYCNIGMQIWYSRSAARYNHYQQLK